MVFSESLKLRIEPNSFGSIRLTVVKDGKVLSFSSSEIPAEVRQLSRYSLSGSQFSSMLIDFLNNNPTIPLQVKVKHVFIDCFWDVDFVSHDALSIEYANDKVFINSFSSSLDKFIFAKQFCLDLRHNKLGLYQFDQNSELSRYLTFLKASDDQRRVSSKRKLKKDLSEPSLSFPVVDFNKKSDMLFEQIPDKYFKFFRNNTLVNPTAITAEYRLKVNYAFDDILVKLSPELYNNDLSVPVSKSIFAQSLNMSFDIFSNFKERQADFVLHVILFCLSAQNQFRQQRLLSHFLKKVIKSESDFNKVLSFVNHACLSFDQFRLLVDEDTFYWSKVSYLKELYVVFTLRHLFKGNYVDKDDTSSYLVISKDQFHSNLDRIKRVLAKVDVDLHFESAKVELEDHNLVVDFRDIHNQELIPDIYVDDQLVEEGYFKGLEQNIWSYVTDETVKVLNPKTVAKIKEILNLIQFKKTVKQKTDQNDVMKSLHLLDWVQMKQMGVKVLLTKEQEALMNSFLTFKELNSITPPQSMKSLARGYQVKCLGWLDFIYRFQLGGILADDMGLGKTFQTIMFLALLKEGGIKNNCENGQHVIVVPPSLIYNWEYEIKKFYPDFKVCIYTGLNRQWDDDADIVMVTYDLLRREIEFLEKKTINVLVFDEAQLLKNKSSERTKAANRLNNHFVLCLTGTPIENNLLEYYTIFELTIPNLFGSFSVYNSLIKQKNYKQIINRSKPFILRRLKSDLLLELPKKVEQTVFLTISDSQREYYDSVVAQLRELVDTGRKQKKDDKQPFSQIIALNLLLRLRQICVSPALIDDEYTELTPKFLFLQERLATLKSEGYSALVFSQFTKSLDIAEQVCQSNGFSYFRLDGSTSLKKRKQMITDFQSTTEPQVFLISLKAGGMGLNLTKASYVFHVDPWWNPAVEAQATDRTHRIGQERKVFSFRLAMHDTVEEKILEMNDKKRDLFNMFFEDSQIVKRNQILTQNDLSYLVENV